VPINRAEETTDTDSGILGVAKTEAAARREPLTMAEQHAAAGRVCYTYRLRLSGITQRTLSAEWDRCRWVWNQCNAESRAAHRDERQRGGVWLSGDIAGPLPVARLRARTRLGSRLAADRAYRLIGIFVAAAVPDQAG